MRRFESFGFPLVVDKTIIPKDDSTLFVCSGMQQVRERFLSKEKGRHGSLQSCIRTNDIEEVGDGSHLTYFQMLGNFSFNLHEYPLSIELWHSIIQDLNIKVDEVHCHPMQGDHIYWWRKLGYNVVGDFSCEWSDGNIGGRCCELFCKGLEIGNLVNPLGHSVDVGFGWERLHQVVEGVGRVDQTSLFRSDLHPIVADHSRTLEAMYESGIEPGNRGRNYVCRRLVRRMLRHLESQVKFKFSEWVESERELLKKRLGHARKAWRRNKDKSQEWWWDTFGILSDEMRLLEG